MLSWRCHGGGVVVTGAPEQNLKAEENGTGLPEGLTLDMVNAAVEIVLAWESGEMESDLATDLVIKLYPILRGERSLFSSPVDKTLYSTK